MQETNIIHYGMNIKIDNNPQNPKTNKFLTKKQLLLKFKQNKLPNNNKFHQKLKQMKPHLTLYNNNYQILLQQKQVVKQKLNNKVKN